MDDPIAISLNTLGRAQVLVVQDSAVIIVHTFDEYKDRMVCVCGGG